jgi:low affinity Fe/Cu permease
VVSSRHEQRHVLERFSGAVARRAGGSAAFTIAFVVVLAWAATGPIFGYSTTWQLVINTGTTIVTFLMVFLIQRAQNKDALAIQLKLNELVAAMKGASNRLVDIEDLREDELEVLHRYYQELARLAKNKGNLFQSHSIDEAKKRHKDH